MGIIVKVCCTNGGKGREDDLSWPGKTQKVELLCQ